jgi:hypothetical protein
VRTHGRLFAVVLAALGAAALCACKTEQVRTSDGRPMPPEPHAAPPVPDGALANALVARVGAKPADTDGNGYPDLIQLEAYLFSRPHPSPMHEEGAFVFTLHPGGQSSSPGVAPIAQWRLDAARVRDCRMFSPIFGPAYAINLSLLECGSDQLPLTGADLACRFEPADGRAAVVSERVHWIQLGRMR